MLFWNTKERFWKRIKHFLRNTKTLLENKRALMENKKTIPGNIRALLEKNKGNSWRRHFWEVKGHIDLKTKALATSPLPIWSGHFWMFQAKIIFKKSFQGHFLPMGQISWPLNSLKYPLILRKVLGRFSY